MMRRVLTAAFVGLAVLSIFAVPANAAQGLECMAASYDAEDLAAIENALPGFDIGGAEDTTNPSASTLSELALDSVINCSGENSWSDRRAYLATIYEGGRLFELGFRRSKILAPEQLRKVDDALATGDHEPFWALMERGLTEDMDNQEPYFIPQERLSLGLFLVGAGLANDDATAKSVGGLLALMAMQRVGLRDFTALAGK